LKDNHRACSKEAVQKSIELVFGDPLASVVKRVSEKVGTPQITINRILKERALIDSAEYTRVAVKVD